MMSTDNIPTKPAGGEDNQISSGGDPPSKCPRCDSPNTKFCYYNNYSLTQPRHFCKTCRRYWTKGGALRNVPIGGGCRKNKRTKSTTSTIFSGDSKDSPTSSHSGFNFFQENSPAMDFQIGNGGGLPFSRLQYTNINHQFVTCATNPSCFDHPIGIRGDGGFKYIDGGIREMGSMNVNSSLASSIESLSCMNQDLHWKLQQQRLAMVLGEETNKDGECVSDLPVVTAVPEIQIQKPQPITFQNLGISKQEANMKSGMSGATTTEWVFENSYTNPTSTTTTITTNNNNSGGNENDNTSSWNGIQAWTDLHHYSGLP